MGILATAWAGLGEDPAALALVRDRAPEVPLGSNLPVGRLVHDAIAAASLSAALLAARRSGSAVPPVELDPLKVATAVTSEKHFRVRGEYVPAWSEFSGYWRTADGWVRTHGNYQHHRARLLGALGLADDATAEDLRAALAARSAADVEELVTAAGGLAVAMRTREEWAGHPQAAVVRETPLIELTRIGDAPAAATAATTLEAPAAGIRVLDLTRVIAGPVATRTLALWGAEVLRLDSPRLPEGERQHLDTGAGKRSALLDFDADREVLDGLVAGADVVVTGYRPGALDRFGLAPAELAKRHPGIIVARLSAWGNRGPFAARRGFDSIVQAATGIGWAEGDGNKPGALPAQALDHSAGYLIAAAVTTALRRRIDEGGSWLIDASLARIAQELLAAPAEPGATGDWEPTVVTHGGLTTAAAAPHYEGGPDRWASPATPWGSGEAVWVA